MHPPGSVLLARAWPTLILALTWDSPLEVLQEPSCRVELREMGAAAQQLGWGGGWPGNAAGPALDSESSRVLGGQRDSLQTSNLSVLPP